MPNPFQLYYAPFVCSLPPHIVLRELDVPFELVRVDLRTGRLADGRDYAEVQPKRYVPALALPEGGLIGETAIILRYLADRHPDAALAPPPGSPERLGFDEQLHFIATELHKGFAPFTIMPDVGPTAKQWAADRLAARVSLLARALGDQQYFAGAAFSVLDAYAFWALRNFARLPRLPLPDPLAGFVARLAERPAVRAALAAEQA